VVLYQNTHGSLGVNLKNQVNKQNVNFAHIIHNYYIPQIVSPSGKYGPLLLSFCKDSFL
jgi:hypothetical protein